MAKATKGAAMTRLHAAARLARTALAVKLLEHGFYAGQEQIMIALDRWFAGWETQYSPAELETWVKKSGLEVESTYGEWFVPGFFYRSLRYFLMRTKITVLPKYPPEIPPFGAMGRAFRESFKKTRLGLYTCAMIGTLGRKP